LLLYLTPPHLTHLIVYPSISNIIAGINKKAALFEASDNYREAVQLYENSIVNGRINALLLFNLGWCVIHGLGVVNKKKDAIRGRQLWKEAVALAPDQGSEEAAWFLYKEYERDDPTEAQHWYDIAIALGYYE
jgi:TPR repeat protein